MPDRAPAADSGDQPDGGYFAPLASAGYLRITTYGRHGNAVSASVPGMADGDRGYFRARSRSGTVNRLRDFDAVQATPSGVLGFFSYGPPLDAIARRLSGDEASRAAAKLDSRYPLRQRFPIRLLRRDAVYYELVPGEAAADQDMPADSASALVIRVAIRQETGCADATAPTSLATLSVAEPG
jgi:PPOX class probable F420-dependent enzyme